MSPYLFTLAVSIAFDHGGTEPDVAMVPYAYARGSGSSPRQSARPLPTVRVVIDTSALGEVRARELEAVVRAKTEKLLEDEGWFMDDAAKDAIVVRVEYVDREDLEYGIHIHVYDDGQEVQPGEEWIVCKYCSHALVGERYAERLPKVLGRLAGANQKRAEEVAAREREAAAGTGEPAREAEPKPGPGSLHEDPGPQPERSLALRNAGLGVLVPGGVALGVGIAMLIVGTREVDRETPDEILERHYRPPGIAVTVIGAVAASAGVGLLIAHTLRDRRAGPATTRVTVGPMFGHQTGVVLHGRF